jgi:hypothetical protein
MNALLPPSDDKTRSTQVAFLWQVREAILEHAENDADIKKMVGLVFDILTNLDGLYNKFPLLSIIEAESGNLISGDLHDVFSLIIEKDSISLNKTHYLSSH